MDSIALSILLFNITCPITSQAIKENTHHHFPWPRPKKSSAEETGIRGETHWKALMPNTTKSAGMINTAVPRRYDIRTFGT